MNKLILSLVGGAALFAAQTNAETVNVTGAGSTFDYPAFTKWFEAYGKVDPGVQFNYQSIGSGGGIKNCSTRPWISALPTRR
jgi:phosphate transport system substrate-binding protein